MMRERWIRAGLFLGALGLLLLGGAAQGYWKTGADRTPLDFDTESHIDANQVDMFVTNYGSFAWDISTGDPGLIFPKGTTKTALFAAGLWIGAKVDGEVRVTVAEYDMEYGPGTVTSDSTFADPESQQYRAYRIKKGDQAVNPDSANYNADLAEWPVADGAPVDAEGDPLLRGDQTIWAVYNDMDATLHLNLAGSSTPLGLEVQQTTFAYNEKGPLENVVFIQYRIINKGRNTLEDTYVSIWSDPDLGGASDDLVGCDTLLSLGYCYNATNNDNLYGSTPPAIGFDFFQGPIVPSPGDTAHVSGRAIPGYRNLPMTSFNKYINGNDPDSRIASYNFMSGLNRDGSPVTDPTTGHETHFFVPGDPVTIRGWLDTNPADRRMMLSSGPFTMAPGDTQEVVTAILVGQGRERRSSITALKFYDLFAQKAFDVNFDLPAAPPLPTVRTGEQDGAISLAWDDRSETEYDEPGYAFEGYNVYMGASIAGPWTLIKTYDEDNNVGTIFDTVFDQESGVVVDKPVEFGSDTAPGHSLLITEDAVNGGGLRNGKAYYFGVTAYSYNPNAAPGLKTRENAIVTITAVPQSPTAGTRDLDGSGGDLLAVEHVAGTGDGQIIPVLVDPGRTTRESYEITYGTDASGLYWDLKTVGGREVLMHQRNVLANDNYFERDGVLWKQAPQLPDYKFNAKGNPMFDEIAGPGGVEVPPDGNLGPGNDVWHDGNSTGQWLLSAFGGAGDINRFNLDGADLANLTTSDIIMKWDNDPDNIGFWDRDDGSAGVIPFGLYLKDPITGEETRLFARFFTGDGNTPGVFDLTAAPDSERVTDPVSGWPGTDLLYAYTILGPYSDIVDDFRADGVIDHNPSSAEVFRRLLVCSPDSIFQLPAEGTIIKFSTTKPNTPEDVFRISTQGVTYSTQVAKNDLSQVRVVPNPYYAHSIYELNQFERRVKFTHLPAACTIRIFNIAGDLVRTLDKSGDASSIFEWDLLTSRQLPVASGVYIYHVEAKDGGRTIGTTVGRMAIFIEKERLNTF